MFFLFFFCRIQYKITHQQARFECVDIALTIGGHGTLQKYRGTGTRYFAKISTAVPVPVLSN